MTGRNSLHYCYDVSYQCWFASEEAKIYCYNFNRSNAVVCSHLILAYSKCDRIGTKWLFFFTLIEECCAVIEKNIDKKLVYRISYQIWYKRYLKGMFGRRVQICEGGPCPLADLDRRGPGDITLSHFTQRYTICVYAIPLDTTLSHFTLRYTVCMYAVPFYITLSYFTQCYTICTYAVLLDIILCHLTQRYTVCVLYCKRVLSYS